MIGRVVMFSGGAGSWGAARRLADRLGRTDGLTLLFADTLIEDDDLYRFLIEAAANVAGTSAPRSLIKRTAAIPPLDETERRGHYLRDLAADARAWLPALHWIADGREPHQVFSDRRFLGNSRVDPCSAVLKRDLMRRWLGEHRHPEQTVAVLGFDWSEIHRVERAADHWQPWRAEAPLCDRPYLSKEEVLGWLRTEGIEPPRLYAEGFKHNNCGGFCVKGGQAAFALLLRKHPDRFIYHERREQELREALGRNVAILRDRRGGAVRPLTLRELRRRLERRADDFEQGQWGACSCMEPAPGASRRGSRGGSRRGSRCGSQAPTLAPPPSRIRAPIDRHSILPTTTRRPGDEA